MGRDATLKEHRLVRIREILRAETVGSQQEIAERLRREGFAVTQSSVSRDLRQLGVAKRGGRYVLPGESPAERSTALKEVAGTLRGTVSAGPNLLIVHTVIGAAPRVGLEIDRQGWPEVLGTIAGDDTIFVATQGRKQQAAVQRRLAHAARGENSRG